MILEMIAVQRAVDRELIGRGILLFEGLGHGVPTCRNQYPI